MTNFKTIAAFALIAVASVSCQKENQIHINVVERNDQPKVEVPFQNDICVVDTEDGITDTGYQFLDKYIPVQINSNALVTTQEIGEYYKDGHLGSVEYFGGAFWIGNNDARFYYNINKGYTFDTALVLGQTIFTNETFVYSWDDFKNYGPIEKYVNFRVRGAKGTLYIEDYIEDLNSIENGGKGRNGESSEDQLNKNTYYIKGTLKSIAQEDTFESKLICLQLYNNYFKDGGYYPAITSCKGISENLVIGSESGDYTLTITGRERDNDLQNLHKYIKVGDKVEIPIKAISKAVVDSKDLGQAIYCRILKLTE